MTPTPRPPATTSWLQDAKSFPNTRIPKLAAFRSAKLPASPATSCNSISGSKLGLFVAVFDGLQYEASLRIKESINQHQNPWERARAGIAAFLDASTPAYRTVVLKEGPAVIGWERWRELDREYNAHLIGALIEVLGPTELGGYALAMLAATVRGTLTELSFEIAQSSDQAIARREALAVADRLLTGLRATPDSQQPIRIGIGQLRASASTYLDRAAAGETIEVLRRGRVVARLQSTT